MPRSLPQPLEFVPATDLLVIPTHVILAKIHEVRHARPVLQDLADGGASDALAAADYLVSQLEAIIGAGTASADDELCQREAEAWSGLSADTLQRNYPNSGARAARRWRRGDLPVRSPFGQGTPHVDRRRADCDLREAAAAALRVDAVPAPTDDDLLTRALEESHGARRAQSRR